jgi:hypothetical protein
MTVNDAIKTKILVSIYNNIPPHVKTFYEDIKGLDTVVEFPSGKRVLLRAKCRYPYNINTKLCKEDKGWLEEASSSIGEWFYKVILKDYADDMKYFCAKIDYLDESGIVIIIWGISDDSYCK